MEFLGLRFGCDLMWDENKHPTEVVFSKAYSHVAAAFYLSLVDVLFGLY